MDAMTATMRILEPYPGIYAYYDGRIEGKRLHSEGPNWVDDGAYSLGIASYAVVGDGHAIVYDTHMTIEHARAIRRHLEELGVATIQVVLSHWHTDHIAGNVVFADCEIIALKLTADTMEANRAKLETGTPPILPLVMPTRTFEESMALEIGGRRVELHHFNIHSADGCVLWLPEERILLAGDTLEDTVTYISEPEHIETHIAELERMATWPIERILPNHGDPDRIEIGGYHKTLIDANREYLERLIDPEESSRARTQPLQEFLDNDISTGAVIYFAPYETVHRENVAAVGRDNPHD
ncbi:MBL fold metallo-hydrolase [Rhizobium sp. TH2]|uniref:MBL fold metallo-hydrolase n=1 Tax=Rhizobium sp. TH2 TaxID=2775403 RepID=UPI0021575857|nr:MBL fold metallo-hydrolase [Rhizobium sp. TH2]UVC10941.1 MBL fold metallo-hydrolase [Rhizobium sp. TH2]